MGFPLSVLDLAPLPEGVATPTALARTVDLARLADRLGYTRLWFAEHHNLPSVASTTPEILIAHVAPHTTRLRLGSGGVMLPNHAPLKVAESYRMLEALHPGRIDLGIGRAPGTDPTTALALRGSRDAMGANRFPEQLQELRAYGGQVPFADDDPFSRVRAVPDDVPLPPIWLLGSSDFGARHAARHGFGFSFAGHFNPEGAEAALLAYRRDFQPSPSGLERPHAILALSVVCAPTLEEAERLTASHSLAFVRMHSGHAARLPTPDEALAYPYASYERTLVEHHRAMQIVGTPDTVRPQIEEWVARTQADEVMVSTMTHGHEERLRSYELVAQAFDLPSRANAA